MKSIYLYFIMKDNFKERILLILKVNIDIEELIREEVIFF